MGEASLTPLGNIRPHIGWQPLPVVLTPVTPSAQVTIKISGQADHLRSSTIADSIRLNAAPPEGAAALIQSGADTGPID